MIDKIYWIRMIITSYLTTKYPLFMGLTWGNEENIFVKQMAYI